MPWRAAILVASIVGSIVCWLVWYFSPSIPEDQWVLYGGIPLLPSIALLLTEGYMRWHWLRRQPWWLKVSALSVILASVVGVYLTGSILKTVYLFLMAVDIAMLLLDFFVAVYFHLILNNWPLYFDYSHFKLTGAMMAMATGLTAVIALFDTRDAAFWLLAGMLLLAWALWIEMAVVEMLCGRPFLKARDEARRRAGAKPDTQLASPGQRPALETGQPMIVVIQTGADGVLPRWAFPQRLPEGAEVQVIDHEG